MLLAEPAVLVHLKSVGIILLVLHGVVVSLLTLCAGQGDLYSHFSAPPYTENFSLPRLTTCV